MGMMMRRLRAGRWARRRTGAWPRGIIGVFVLLISALLAGCELDEVTAPPAEDILVIEAVLRAGRPLQYVLLHRSIDGAMVPGETGARVEVTGEDGRVIRFTEAPLQACSLIGADDERLGAIELEAVCYVSTPVDAFFVQPGGSYELFVETVAGEVARGRTTLPGSFGFIVPAVRLRPRTLTADCTFPESIFQMVWRKAEGAWSYLLMLELRDWSRLVPAEDLGPDPLQLLSVSVSANDTTIVFPTNIGLFQRGELDQRVFAIFENGIPAGVRTRMVVMAAERNYTNAIRGGRFNPSGPVRVSSVVGDAVGVFGGVVPIVLRSEDIPGLPTPPCGMPPI